MVYKLPQLTELNPYVTIELSHSYHLDKSTFILGASGVFFLLFFLFHFSMKFMSAKRIAPCARFAASHLGLFCLPMSHEKDAMLILVDTNTRLKLIPQSHNRNTALERSEINY